MPEAPRQCFVISPIGKEGSNVRRHADEVLKHIIEPAMKRCGIRAVRSDALDMPGRITEQVFERVLHDDLCVALLTGHSPNVYYELAIAHAARRPVVIMIDKGEELPFDVKDLRCVTYDLWPTEIIAQTYVDALVRQVEQIRATNWTVAPISAEFRHLSDDDPSNPARTHSRQVFAVIGLDDHEPIESELFQSFAFDVNDNRNPVASLWADPQPGNFIRANLADRDGLPVLRVEFSSTSDSLAPAVAVHPQGLVARTVPAQATTLTFRAAVRERQDDTAQSRQIVMGVRVVNGFAEHWRYIRRHTDGLQQFRLTADLTDFQVDLTDLDAWKPFSGAGTRGQSARALLKVVASVVFQCGSATKGIDLGPGDAVVDIADIRFA